MAAITIVKLFTYRGESEEWSNTHHLDHEPVNATAWDALAMQIWGFEAGFLDGTVRLQRAIGHPAGGTTAVWEADYTGQSGPSYFGSFTPAATDHRAPGDVAMWLRWATTQVTSRGKPIYLRSYYHGVFVEANGDSIAPGQKTALDVLGNSFHLGMSIGTDTFKRAGPRGALAQAYETGTYATTRTLERRGRRKKPPTQLIAPGLAIPPGDYSIN